MKGNKTGGSESGSWHPHTTQGPRQSSMQLRPGTHCVHMQHRTHDQPKHNTHASGLRPTPTQSPSHVRRATKRRHRTSTSRNQTSGTCAYTTSNQPIAIQTRQDITKGARKLTRATTQPRPRQSNATAVARGTLNQPPPARTRTAAPCEWQTHTNFRHKGTFTLSHRTREQQTHTNLSNKEASHAHAAVTQQRSHPTHPTSTHHLKPRMQEEALHSFTCRHWQRNP